MLLSLIFVMLGLTPTIGNANPPEYLLKHVAGGTTGDQTYELHEFDLDTLMGTTLQTFKVPAKIDQFITRVEPRDGKRRIYVLSQDKVGVVLADGTFQSAGVYQNYKAIVPGPDDSILCVQDGAKGIVMSISAKGGIGTLMFGKEVLALTWHESTPSVVRALTVSGSGTLKTYHQTEFDLTKYQATDLGSFQFKTLTHVQATRGGITFLNSPGAPLLIEHDTNSLNGLYQLPASLPVAAPLTLLEAIKQSDGSFRVWMRAGTDLVKLRVGQQATLLATYPNAFAPEHLTEAPNFAGHFNYSNVEGIAKNDLQKRLSNGTAAAAQLAELEKFNEPALFEQYSRNAKKTEAPRDYLRAAVRDEIARLNATLRYIGLGQATLSSADWARALRDTGQGEFWTKSLFGAIDAEELIKNPVSMDELVDVLAIKLPKETVCSIPMVNP